MISLKTILLINMIKNKLMLCTVMNYCGILIKIKVCLH